jgi:lipid-binding SYLF domain-containing protein
VKAGVTVGYVEENGATKGNVVSADVYQMVDADGILAGVSLDRYVIGERSRHNLDYYGRRVSSRDILLDRDAHNPAASPGKGAQAPFGGLKQDRLLVRPS